MRLHNMLAVAGAIVCVLPCGCRSPAQPGAVAGEHMRFRNWWNFYERGIARIERRDYAGARDDFETALGIRGGARFGFGHDQWRIRTYGVHFLEGYFPNRELGVALYELGDVDGALKYLDTSLKQTPSGRAKYYHNLAESRKLAGLPFAPPRIDVADADAVRFTRERTLRIRGAASAKGLVRSIEIGDQRPFIELAQEEIPFDRSLPLHAGENLVRITATDLAGREGSTTVRCRADWTPPSVAVEDVAADRDEWRARVLCFDDVGLAEVRADGKPLATPQRDDQKSLTVEVAGKTGGDVRLEVRDVAGNVFATMVGRAAPAVASAVARFPVQLALADAEGVADTPAPILPTTKDKLRPTLRLSETRPMVIVYRDEFFVTGQARDGGGLAAVTINGEDVLPDELRGFASPFYFARRLPLDMGTNAFEVVCVDTSGNVTRKDLVIVRDTPEYLQLANRITVALPVVNADRDDVPAEEIRATLEAELARDPPRFRVLLRSKEQLDLLLREHELSLSGLADSAARLDVKKLLPAELFLLGATQSHGDGITILVNVMNAEDGELISSEDVYCPELSDNVIVEQAGGLALKIEQRFPLVEGRVKEVMGQEAVIDRGRREGVDRYTRFLVVQRGANQSSTFGRLKREGDRPVELLADVVEDDSATAEIRPGAGAPQVRKGDYVYSR